MSNTKKTQKTEYRRLFNLFDINHDGSISYSEFWKLLKKYRLKISQVELEKELIKFDKNGDKSIDFDEFVEIITSAKFQDSKKIDP
jgi:Ca2+-binding EF-hand superfamily protein